MDEELLKHYYPDWEDDGLTMKQAMCALYFCLHGRNVFDAYNAVYGTHLRSHQANKTKSYFDALKMKVDPPFERACAKITKRVFDEGKDKLKNEVLQLLYEQATFDPADILDSEGNLVTNIEEMPAHVRRQIKHIDKRRDGSKVYSIADRMQAIKMLGEYIGLATPASQITLTVSKKQEEELEEAFNEGMV